MGIGMVIHAGHVYGHVSSSLSTIVTNMHGICIEGVCRRDRGTGYKRHDGGLGIHSQ